MNELSTFFSSDQFAPHGYCLMWRPDVFWLHVVSDGLIALAYFSIPAAIAVFAMRRKRLGYRWLFWMFSAFVLACGMTHLFNIWTMWIPSYGASAVMKAATALVSVATALAIWPLLPRALQIPTVAELEQQVRDRTRELEKANAALTRENRQRAEAERQLRTAKNEVEAASNAKSSFLSVMSHELRTPLNAILGYAQLLEMISSDEIVPSNDNNKEYLTYIRRSGEHLLSMIEQILDLSQVETGRMAVAPRQVVLKDACSAAIAEVMPIAFAKQVKITLDDAESGTLLFADPTRVQQVLSNLITNAVKYNDPGGEVRVVIRGRHDGLVDVRVEDNGWGVPASRLDELFKPFARLGRDGGAIEGAGIGLALTRRLVELMGGTIRYEPNDGAGAVFVVTLRTMESAEDAVYPTPERAARAEPTTPLTVLYIEDNSSNVDLMRQIFGLVISNAELVIAESGMRGVEIAEATEPDLILLDIGLQDMDGFAVLEALRDRLGARMPRVVFVTADATPKTRERAAALGIVELVTKPFDVNDIVAITRASA